jgi:DNA replication and repair protein RecF
MRLAGLEVSCVRNLSHVHVDLVDGVNLFIGANGAGKTSLLEAVYLLARGRSFRTSHIASVVQRGAPALSVRATVADEYRGTLTISLHKRRDNVAEAQVNGVPERKQSDVAMLLPLQLLLPDGATLVMGGPGERRRFLDWGVFHVKPSALATLRDYERALRQRNAMLRSARGQTTARAA